jgi:hypothetical protein
MSSALKIIPQPQDPAAVLHAEKAKIAASMAEADRQLTRLAQAQREEERVFAEIAKLGEKEIEAVKVWVASGCEGPKPQPDAEARRELTERMGRAVDATKAAKAVAAEVEAEADRLRSRLVQVDAEIRTLKIGSLENQFADRVSEFAALAEKMRRALLEIRALPIALIDIGRAAFDRGDEAFARACYSAGARMRETRLVEVEPAEVEILRAVASLTGAIVSGGEIRLGAPIDQIPAPNRDALMAKVAAANQAQNKLTEARALSNYPQSSNISSSPRSKPGVIGDPQEIVARSGETPAPPPKNYSQLSNYTPEERRSAALLGDALPDGSHIIRNADDLGESLIAWARSGKPKGALKDHIATRANALRLSASLPPDFKADADKLAFARDLGSAEGCGGAKPRIFGNLRVSPRNLLFRGGNGGVGVRRVRDLGAAAQRSSPKMR